MDILIFLLVLFVLVLVHEWGHFIVAKKSGIRVDEFGIGFPPKVFGYRPKGSETEYTLNWLPIGGFVRIYGEDAEDAARDEAEGKDTSRSFVAKSKWKQAAVLVAGVAMNVLFAWFLFAIALGVGVPTVVDEETASEEAKLFVTHVVPDSPAADAGLTPGTSIVSVRTNEVSLAEVTPASFSAFTEEYAGEEILLSYTRGDEIIEATLTPETGVLEESPERTAVGIALALTDIVSRPVHTAVAESFTLTLASLRDITVGLSGLIWDAVRADADLSQVAGPVGIVGLVGEASAFGLTALLMFTAFISLNLAVINLLPFPALDGGRLLFVAIEAVKGSPINPVWAARLNTVGFALLILLMVAVTYNDIVRIL